MASNKIKNDKYYTSPKLAEYVVNKTKEVIGEKNITEYLEPSGGNGVFLEYLPKETYSCDIEPEDNRVVKQDYLTLDMEYKNGRCVIGNPPFGTKMNLVVSFYKKSLEIADYISFILPVSQLNNNIKLYEFDLIHSENLGKQQYSDREVHCCLNIYRRNSGGLNKKPNYKLKDIEIVECILNKNPKRANKYNGFDYTYAICAWGTVGEEVTDKHYAKEFYFIIHNEALKDKILSTIKNANWRELYPMTNTPNLLQWQVYKYLKEQIPELE